jgi:hypothetical protein
MRVLSYVLLTIAAAVFALTAAACGSGNGNGTPKGPDWGEFEPLPAAEGQESASLMLSEVYSRVGFPLVLPTYLPDSMSTYFRDEIGKAADTLAVQAEIFLVPKYASGGPNIAIYESQAGSAPEAAKPCDPADCETDEIGGTSVVCRVVIPDPGVTVSQPPPPTSTPPEDNPRLRCQWQNGGLSLQIEFGWVLDEPVPGGVSAEMRAEAMQVVTSMIEAPYTVGQGS